MELNWPEATALSVFIVSFAACFIASMFAPPLDDPFWDEEEDDDEKPRGPHGVTSSQLHEGSITSSKLRGS